MRRRISSSVRPGPLRALVIPAVVAAFAASPLLAAPPADPVADAGPDRTALVGETYRLDGGASFNSGGGVLGYAWTVVSVPAGSAAALNDATLARPEFVVDLPGAYEFDLVVSKGAKSSAPDRVIISTVNSAPAANAGAAQSVSTGALVLLDGSGSTDPDGDALSYAWTLAARPGGSSTVLSDATAARPTFTADVAGDYALELVVNDGTLSSGVATVLVSTSNVNPVASAGIDEPAGVGQTIQLDAGGSLDADIETVSIDWDLLHRPAGSVAKVTKPNEDRPNLTVDLAGDYVVQLVIGDGAGEETYDTKLIATGDLPPVADAGGPLEAVQSQPVQLDAAGSHDPNGGALAVSWSLLSTPAGSTASLDDPYAIRPSFTADLAGDYVAQLRVSDGVNAPVLATALATTGSLPPVADAGPDVGGAAGVAVQLDATASLSFDGQPLSYQWTMVDRPNGAQTSFSDPASPTATFTGSKAGVYLIQLTVTDSASRTDHDSIIFETNNVRPIADAGPDQSVRPGAVQLDGSASADPDAAGSLTYEWAITVKPAGSAATLSSAAAQSPTFTADLVGEYLVQLFVSDGALRSLADTVHVAATNTAPIADAGANQNVALQTMAALDGTGSFDPDGDSFTYAWSIASAPAGSFAALDDPTLAQPSFFADLSGDYVIDLVVTDQFGASSTVSTTTVTAPGTGGANFPPYVKPVPPQVILLGEELVLQLEANDPNGDPLTFSATTLPLPDGATLSQSGLFKWRPTAGQIGQTSLTFTAFDGALTGFRAVSFDVQGDPQPGLTGLTGYVYDAISAVGGQDVPVVGAVVTIEGTALSATTDAAGAFTLSNMPDPSAIFKIDASGATPAPDGSGYGDFVELIHLEDGVTNVIERPFYLPRVDPALIVTVDPAQPTVVDNPALGVSMTIPAGTAMDANGQPYTGPISIVEVPVEFAPVAMPEEVTPALLISIQPSGAIFFDQPVPITFPNADAMADGNEMELMSVDPDTGVFINVGTGQTSGGDIATVSGGIRSASWHFAIPPVTDPEPIGENGENQEDPEKDCQQSLGSASAACTGALIVEHATPAHQSLGAARSVELVYNSLHADPRPIVSAEATVPLIAAVPNTVSTRVRLGGVDVGSESFTQTGGFLSENIDEDLLKSVQFDARQFPTGVARAEIRVFNNYNLSQRASVTARNLLIRNEMNSPFGAGWSMKSLQKLHLGTGTGIVLTEGEGGTKLFAPGLGVGAPANVASLDLAYQFATGDFNGDGWLDVAVPDGEQRDVIVLINDQQGGFTESYRYDFGGPITENNDLLSVAAGDLDGDGVLDLSAVSQIGDRLTVLAGQGDGTFVLVVDFPVTQPTSTGMADFNGDGNLDVAISRAGNALRIYRGDGSFGFTNTQYSVGGKPAALAIGDVDGDGDLDIVTSNTTSDTISLARNTGSGFSVQSQVPMGPILDSSAGIWTVALGDINGDGFDDAVVSNTDNDTVSYRLSNGDGTFGGLATVAVGDGPTSVDLKDLNADGFADLIVGDAFARTVSIALADGAGGLNAATQSPTFGHVPYTLRAEDFDNDGVLDVMVGSIDNPTGSVGGMWLFEVLDGASDTEFNGPAGDFTRLAREENDTYTRAYPNGRVVTFDAAGLMISDADRNGNTTTYAYNASDQLTSITDPAGLVTTLAYSGGKLASITDPASRTTSFTHDANGDLTGIGNPDGTSRSFAYDGDHRMLSRTNERSQTTAYSFGHHGRNTGANRPDGSVRSLFASALAAVDGVGFGSISNPSPVVRPGAGVATFTNGRGGTRTIALNGFGSATSTTDALTRTTSTVRDENSDPIEITGPDGVVDAFSYDGRGNLLTVTNDRDGALTRTSSFAYEPVFSRVTQITDPDGKITSIDYDANGNPTLITDPLLNTVSATFNAQGLPLTRTDQASETTSFTYDANGNVETITDADGTVTRFTRDAAGNVLTVVEAEGTGLQRTSTFTYDQHGRILTAADPTLAVTTFTYDGMGNVLTVQSPTGETTIYTYDEMDRVASIDDPVRGLTAIERDADGNVTKVTDALGAETTYVYDLEDRLTSMTDAILGQRIFAYDDTDNLVSVTDARGETTTFLYDDLDRLVSRSDPIGKTRSFAYDARDNLISTTDPKLQTVTASYDDLSRLLSLTTPDNALGFTYDARGLLLTASDNDSALTFTYDALARLETAATTGGLGPQPAATLTNTYDILSNRTQIADTFGGQLSYGWDGADRLTGLTIGAGGPNIALGYDAAGRVTSVTHPNAVAMAATYDADGRLSELAHTLGAADLARFMYAYNAVGSITQIDEPSIQTRNFTYDLLQRLTAAGTAAAPESYSYDAEGNRLVSHLSASHTTDAANRLLEDDDFLYTYDDNGNVVTKTDKVTLGVTTYTYDAQDQLVGITFPDATFALYAYDALGRRIAKDVDDGFGGREVTAYLYDGPDILLETDGAGVLLARYAHGDRVDQPLAMTRAGQDYYIHADHQGSIVRVTDNAGVVVNSYEYDAYGQRLAATEGVAMPYGYTGREYDAESGLMHYRARTYDPSTGRFLQTDPIGFGAGDANLYRYVANNPVSFTDPSGLQVASGKIPVGPSNLMFCLMFPQYCDFPSIPEQTGGMCGQSGPPISSQNPPLPPSVSDGPVVPPLPQIQQNEESKPPLGLETDELGKLKGDVPESVPGTAGPEELKGAKEVVEGSIGQREVEQMLHGGRDPVRDRGHQDRIDREKGYLGKVNEALGRRK